jgi:hypothetical protein
MKAGIMPDKPNYPTQSDRTSDFASSSNDRRRPTNAVQIGILPL